MNKSGLAAFVLATLTTLTQVNAADWASELFPDRSHDFGTVARAAKTEYTFEFVNNTGHTIHISHVRSSCGCTTPFVPTQTVESGDRGSIVARFNTDRFLGQRGATLTVVIDRPAYREVQLRVDGYVRRDIVCTPGSIDFGKTNASEVVRREIDIQYAGRNDWQITDVTSTIPGIEFELTETRRGSGRVGYQLVAEWTANEVGYVQSEITLHTSDSRRPSIPLSVSGQSVSALQVSPQEVFLGQMAPGQVIRKRVVLRAEGQFQVLAAESDDARIASSFGEDAKEIHMVELTFTADESAGDFESTVNIATSAGDSATTTITLKGSINPSVATDDRD